MPSSPESERFGAAYYARHYGRRGAVHTAASIAHLARAVSSYAAWLGRPLRSVLDVGAGPGYWGRFFRRELPRVRYLSVDASPHACARFGHEQRDISRWRAGRRFDLVVCQGVLPYLDDAAAARAIGNLAAMCGGLLYLEALTRGDAARVADRDRTDLAIRLRDGAWYRTRLRRRFLPVGAGLWARRGSGLRFWELEGGQDRTPGGQLPGR
jgi:SAM-dependent methyltransferase